MTEVDPDKLRAQLVAEEGYEATVYKDSLGNLTGGIGHKLTPVDNYKLGDSLTIDQINSWYNSDIAAVQTELDNAISWVFNLDEIRLRAVFDLCFNMGIGTLLTFKNTLDALKAGDWEKTAEGLEYSLWYKQVGTRGPKIAAMMRTGQDQ